jgi:Carboxypeptidase regulatory-like domain
MRTSFIYFALLATVVFSFPTLLCSQQPPQTPAQQSIPPVESSSQQKPGSARRHSHDFLVRGTVFTEQGLALPGAELRIRRSAEKKSRWQALSNSRGDFAVRVKMGADYEVLVRAKGYQDLALPVDAKTGERFKDLVFRMQLQKGRKS